MIKKITTEYPDFDDLKDKINEIIELLNAITIDVDGTKCVDGSKAPAENVQELAKKAEKECRFNPVQADREVYNALTRSENVQPDIESRSENVQDKFAEQRRWIGCVCRFWYNNTNDTLLDYLDMIQTGKNGVVQYYSKESGDWFPHCEPVLPTDDAIYKGGNNE